MNTSESIISDADVQQINDDIMSRKWHDAICEMMMREPSLTVDFGDRLEKLEALLQQTIPNARQRERLTKQIYLLVWVPLILLDRAHRRLWDGFLPDETDHEIL
jgi:hypothetical protein